MYMSETNMPNMLITSETTPKRSTFHCIEELVPPLEVISLCWFVNLVKADFFFLKFPHLRMSPKLPQQIALAKYSTQVSATVRVLSMTKFACRSFVLC